MVSDFETGPILVWKSEVRWPNSDRWSW